MRTRLTVAITALSMSVTAPSYGASAAPAPGVGERESTEIRQYRVLLDEAVSELDDHHFEEARALFRRAHELSPSARTWRGIGMAAFELHDYVESLRALESALSDQRQPLTGAQRRQAQALVGQVRVFVGRFIVQISPQDAVLRVDDVPTTLDDSGALWLAFGRHLVTAVAPGRIALSREIRVEGGERSDLVFDLLPVPVVAPLAAHADESRAGGSEPAGPGWWFAGAGVLAGGAAGGVFWWGYQNRQVASCDDALARGSVCHNRDVLVLREQFALVAAIGGAAGALALGVIGAVKWADAGKKNGSQGSHLAFACNPVPGRVSCEVHLSF